MVNTLFYAARSLVKKRGGGPSGFRSHYFGVNSSALYQLSYQANNQSPEPESNQRPKDLQSFALPHMSYPELGRSFLLLGPKSGKHKIKRTLSSSGIIGLKMGYIYMVTNTVNGKKYIGQTRQPDIQRRWQQHRRISKSNLGPHLYNAYVAHGIDAFKFQIICVCFDDDCDKFESEYIERYNTLSPNGYNIKSGGNSSPPSQETREKLRIAATNNMTAERREHLRTLFTGRPIQETQKAQISASLKRYWASLTPEQMQKVSEERKNNPRLRKNISNNKLREYASQRKRVAKYTRDWILIEEYESIKAAADSNQIDHRNISSACRRPERYKSSGGYCWKFI